MSEKDDLVNDICSALTGNPESDWDGALCEVIAHCTNLSPRAIANIVAEIRREHAARDAAEMAENLAAMPVEGSA
jgi:L-fucose isomerase-like protein